MDHDPNPINLQDNPGNPDPHSNSGGRRIVRINDPMRRRTEKGQEKQVGGMLLEIGKRATQALLPIMAGLVAAKEDLPGARECDGP